jgi:hypothetical protein
MPKKIAPTRKSGLHFEKVPLAEVVKKIAPDAAHGRKKGIEDVTDEPGTRPRRPGHFHGVHFYNDPDALCRIVGGFLGEGFEHGALAVVIATPDHAARIESCLRARGIDVDDLHRQGRLVTLDAHETMQLFMINDMPNPGAFTRVISAALTELRRGREQCAIRAYGEMVDILWKDGLEASAIRLETLWNQLATSHDFRLLCGYSMGNFYKGPAIEEIHGQHSHLMAKVGDATALRELRAEPGTAA